MKSLTLGVCPGVFLSGCGSAGSGSTANNVTMQGGQWEYTVVPANAVIPFVVEANLPTANSSFSVSPSIVFWNLSENGLVNPSAPGDCFDLDLEFHASISDTTLKGEFGQPTFANFSGELATNGQSITTGTYSGGFLLGPRILWPQD